MRSVVRRWWWLAALAVVGVIIAFRHLAAPFAGAGGALLPALAACLLLAAPDQDRS
jgi:hypothetical protein